MNPKIAVISCWYGPFPWFFPLFLHSCGFNASVDFIIVTDKEPKDKVLPRNVRLFVLSFESLKKRIALRLRCDITLTNYSKLNDFKPTYGKVFEDLLNGYEFWAYADIDLIYGNIRGFMTNDRLRDYDVLSSRHDYMAGTFSVMRNIELVNNLYLLSKDFSLIFRTEENCCFDECCNNPIPPDYEFKVGEEIRGLESFTHVVRSKDAEGVIRAFFDYLVVDGIPGKIMWRDGRIVYDGKFELLYYNLIKFKRVCKKPKYFERMPLAILFTKGGVVKGLHR